LIAAIGALATAGVAGAAEPRSLVSPYFGAPFEVKANPANLGQAAGWGARGTVLATLLDSAGIKQVYRTRLDGRDQRCLTCKTVRGPNGFAGERRQGDWILFHSYGEQPVHTGGPALGGYGGDLYAMGADGSSPYRLTTDSDSDGVPYDNFHAFFSPDGQRIAWTHTEAHPLSEGGQTWSILVGDFRVRNGKPSLQNVRVVGRPYGA
jgi:Tol biopolymer transport system component